MQYIKISSKLVDSFPVKIDFNLFYFVSKKTLCMHLKIFAEVQVFPFLYSLHPGQLSCICAWWLANLAVTVNMLATAIINKILQCNCLTAEIN